MVRTLLNQNVTRLQMYFRVVHKHVDLAIKDDRVVDTFRSVGIWVPRVALCGRVNTHSCERLGVIAMRHGSSSRCRREIHYAKYCTVRRRRHTDFCFRHVRSAAQADGKLARDPQIDDGIAAGAALLWHGRTVKECNRLPLRIVADDYASNGFKLHYLLLLLHDVTSFAV